MRANCANPSGSWPCHTWSAVSIERPRGLKSHYVHAFMPHGTSWTAFPLSGPVRPA